IGAVPTEVDELPLEVVDNHPLVTPLAILSTKEEVINGKLQKLALIQWQGLSPDDTSWESWDKLQSFYNLDDKAGFDGEGDVMDQNIESQNGPNTKQMGPNTIAYNKPKRNIM
ncbi:hypothetical protein A2U01_0060351, partial [Trifolium medium]|nr:hypothetical protein [Trifolium medium]